MTNNSHQDETYKSLIAISIEAFKALQWLNGGAAIATLTYISQHPDIASQAKCSLSGFLIGLTAATIAFITSYLTQLTLFNEKNIPPPQIKHQCWLLLTFIVVLISVGSFCFAAYFGITALTHTTAT